MRWLKSLLPVSLGSSLAGACATDRHAPSAEEPAAHEYRAHGHHRFDDAEQWAKRFEDPSRDEWQRPDAVLDRLALAEDAVVADIGAATGYFPVRIAPRVPQGKVYGVDIEPAMVRYLEERAAKEGHENLLAVLGAPDDPRLPEPVDLVLVVNTYHHIEQRPAYFERLRAQVKPGGRLVIVDFKPGELPVGPPPHMKVDAERVLEELGGAGWRLSARDDELLPYQYLLVLERVADAG